MKLVMHNNQK